MILYQLNKEKLTRVNENSFKLEKEIQKIVEENIFLLMSLQLVKSELTIKNRRIDTLAFDKQSNAFIIIEYKRDKNKSVIDQGVTYLNLMLENKADFVIEYNERLKGNLKRDDVDWSQTRVVFVSTSFTENQILSTNFKDLGIELWEIKRFENNLISFNNIKKTTSAPSIKPLAKKDKAIQSVASEIKAYTEEEHLEKGNESIRELYFEIKSASVQLDDDIEVSPRKLRMAFTKNGKKFCDIAIYNKQLKLWINLKKGKLNDPKKLGRDVSNVGHWGSGDYEISITNNAEKEYTMSLVKQAIK